MHDAALQPAPTRSPATLLVGMIVALTLALRVNFGQYHPVALLWLGVAGFACLLAVLMIGGKLKLDVLSRMSWPLVLAGVALQFAFLISDNLIATTNVTPPAGNALLRLACGLATYMALFGRPQMARVGNTLMLIGYVLLGVWVIRSTPNVGVDVVIFQRDAAAALLGGINPYAITFPDPYNGTSAFYGPGLSVNGQLQFGYPYPPLALLMALPGQLLGDFRFAQLIAMTLSGALIMRARPGRFATAAAALLLFSPVNFFVLEAGWIEPFVTLLMAIVLFIALRSPTERSRWDIALGIAIGLLFAVKQYMVVMLPVLFLLPAIADRARRRPVFITAVVCGLVVTLPLALWDVRAFVHSVVTLQFHQPFRADALSFAVPLFQKTGLLVPFWLLMGLCIGAGIWAARKLPKRPETFALATALVFLLFFALNKQAFCNYYAFVAAAACCALSAGASPVTQRTHWADELEDGEPLAQKARRMLEAAQAGRYHG